MSNLYDEKSQYQRMLLNETILNTMRKDQAMKKQVSKYDLSIIALYFGVGFIMGMLATYLLLR